MCGQEERFAPLFSSISREDRIPEAQPPRQGRWLMDLTLDRLNPTFRGFDQEGDWLSILPEQPLLALLLQMIHGVRTERRLIEQPAHNLPFRWFAGLTQRLSSGPPRRSPGTATGSPSGADGPLPGAADGLVGGPADTELGTLLGRWHPAADLTYQQLPGAERPDRRRSAISQAWPWTWGGTNQAWKASSRGIGATCCSPLRPAVPAARVRRGRSGSLAATACFPPLGALPRGEKEWFGGGP
jgi:hypothetical protein